MAGIIYFIIPCYNEEKALPITAQILYRKMHTLQKIGLAALESRILFVDDGSKDHTWKKIEQLAVSDSLFTGIRLSHNRGHQNALLAGLMTARRYADASISMDADLQDDVDVVEQFIKLYNDGYDIIYGVRSSRTKDTLFKRMTAEGFYRFMQAMGVEMVFNHADYRLMSKRALDALSKYKEVNLFLRGIVPLIGLRTATVPYERKERVAGESKYPLRKMLAFALDGITSFSVRPIRLLTIIGLLISCASTLAFIYVLVAHFAGFSVPGWSSLACSIWFLGGVQLLALGLIGEYIGKIYAETKHRPRYLIEKQV
ncbi:MAG: glycosyltransferase family 2 protein [Ethanoligenens sp.]